MIAVPNKDNTEILCNNKQHKYIKQTYETSTMACGAIVSNQCVAKDPAQVFPNSQRERNRLQQRTN